MKFSLEQRKDRARLLHKDGYNCSQCVAMVFDDIHGLDSDIVARITSALGGGVGGQRQVCGAVSAMSMIIGYEKFDTPKEKPIVYAEVQSCCRAFQDLNGSIICAELLASRKKSCMGIIEDAIAIIDSKLR